MIVRTRVSVGERGVFALDVEGITPDTFLAFVPAEDDKGHFSVGYSRVYHVGALLGPPSREVPQSGRDPKPVERGPGA